MAWYDFLGKDAGSIARQRLSARAAIPAARAAGGVGSAIRTGLGLTPQGLLLNAGIFAAPYVAEAAANYLRSPQGVLLKDRLGQGDIPGAFTALTGFGRQSSPLRQYNPPGFDPRKPVTSGDLVKSASEVSSLFTGGGSGSPAAERAYQQEKSRVAQLTAQDPELKRYEDARLKAIAPGATPEQVQSAEDIGMQIWRQKYQGTPMAAQGGAVGSFNPLMQRTFGYQTGMSPVQMAELQKTAAPIPVAEGAVPYQTGDLGTRTTLETGYDPAAYGLTPERIEELKNKLLQQKR